MNQHFRVTESGDIVDQGGAILYDAECIEDLPLAARQMLAAIHTDNNAATWDDAEKILRERGYLLAASARRMEPGYTGSTWKRLSASPGPGPTRKRGRSERGPGDG